MRIAPILVAAVASVLAVSAWAQMGASPAQSYKLLNKAAVGGQGSFDYVFADSDGRRLYVPRSNRVDAFDLDTLKPAGTISPTNGVHGAIVDPKSKHGFCSSNPVVMWDTETMKTIKTIPVQGGPDGILFDPFTQHVLILSHSAPNATVIDTKDGTVLGTIDLGGPPEQGASDGNGKLYISLEVAPGKVAVVDSKAMKRTAIYDLGDKCGQLAGLAYDAKNHIIFACGRTPATCAILNADDGTIITTLPIGNGVDSAAFNPNTMEAFVSTGRDGKLTIIKETDPKTFAVEHTVDTMNGAKTCCLDTKTGNIYLIASDPSVLPPGTTAPAAATATAPTTPPAVAGGPGGPGGPGGRGRGRGPAGTFTILVVGKQNP